VLCNEIRQNLTAYLHGELSQQENVEMHRHLSDCESCLTLEIELRQANRVMNKFQFQALPENFDERLAQKLKQAETKTPHQRKNFRRLVYAIAATIIITLGLEIFIYQFIKSTQQPHQLAEYPTKQAVFKTVEKGTPDNASWKQRFLKKYEDSSKKKLSIEKLQNRF